MNFAIFSEETLIKDSIKKVQIHQDQVAFNLLLDKYYRGSCKYASKFLNNRTYSNMISGYFDEIESYVFLAFGKAVKSYRLENTGVLSFKNYLYQLIRFETLKELKSNFNGQCIPRAEQKGYFEDNKKKPKNSFDICTDLEFQQKMEKINQFLNSKNQLYSIIGKLKIDGRKNQEICNQVGITKSELKSRGQYIKKLALEKYSCIDLAS